MLDKELLFVSPRLLIPVGGLAIKLFYQRKAKLREIIGTALYNPPGENISDVISGSKYPRLIKTSSYLEFTISTFYLSFVNAFFLNIPTTTLFNSVFYNSNLPFVKYALIISSNCPSPRFL